MPKPSHKQRASQPQPPQWPRWLVIGSGLALLTVGANTLLRQNAIAWAANAPHPAYAASAVETQLLFINATPNGQALVRRTLSEFTDFASLSPTRVDALPTLTTLNAQHPECQLWGLNAAPRGPWLAVETACGEGGAVQLIDAGTGEVKALPADLGPDSMFLGWLANGNEVLVRINTLGTPQVYHVAAETNTAALLNVPPQTYQVDIAPDGGSMLYALTYGLGHGSELWRAAVDGGNAQRLMADPHHIIAYPRFSPSGDRIAYIRMPDSNIPFTVGELWVMNADGTHATWLAAADAGHGYAPTWSPAGTQLAFVVRENAADVRANQQAERLLSNVYLADINTQAVVAVTQFPAAWVEAPVWSPDGQTLAFSVQQNGARDIWAYDLPTLALRAVTEGANARYPTWLYGK